MSDKTDFEFLREQGGEVAIHRLSPILAEPLAALPHDGQTVSEILGSRAVVPAGTNGEPKPRTSQSRRVLNRGCQRTPENQRPSATTGAERAIQNVQSTPRASAPQDFAGHLSNEGHEAVAGKQGRAMRPMQPIALALDPALSLADQRADDLHGRRVGKRKRASQKANTIGSPLASALSSDGPPAGEAHLTSAVAKRGLASARAKPTGRPPDPALTSNGQLTSGDAHSRPAVAGDEGDHNCPATQTNGDPLIAQIIEASRARTDWLRAKNRLILQGKAIGRRSAQGDKAAGAALFDSFMKGEPVPDAVAAALFPYRIAMKPFEDSLKAIEKQLTKLAVELPIAPWAKSVRGFGMLSLANLVGACGDIGSYKSVSAVWKRMGLAVIQGGRQRRVAGVDALEHGYSPERRSLAWNIGVSLMRAQKPEDAYRAFYDREKAKQLAAGLPAGHAHNRSCRHMTKRLLADLYGAWRA